MPKQVTRQFKKGFKNWAEDRSVFYRKALGLSPFAPLKAFDLVRHFQIDLFRPHDFEGLTTKDLLALAKTKHSWSAVTVKKPNGGFLIIYNNAHALTRTESDLMHEMAHIICGHESSSVKIHPDLGFPLRKHNQEQEDEAEWMGGCLQLPRQALVWALNRGMSMKEVGDYFKASLSMVRYRLNVTGLMKTVKA